MNKIEAAEKLATAVEILLYDDAVICVYCKQKYYKHLQRCQKLATMLALNSYRNARNINIAGILPYGVSVTEILDALDVLFDWKSGIRTDSKRIDKAAQVTSQLRNALNNEKRTNNL